MKKLIYIFVSMLFFACDSGDAPDCLQTTGNIIEREVEVPEFDKVNVFNFVKLYIKQGEEQNVRILAGENLINEVEVTVEDGELRISDGNNCNFFRSYGTTSVYVTIPNLTRIRNSSGNAIESIGVLQFPNLTLVSENQAKDPDVYTNGDFVLQVQCDNLRITNDHISKYFISGTANNFRAGFYGGDGRLDAAYLIAQDVDVFHRGSNKMIVNPQQSLTGEIRSTGNVISVNEPPIVEVESFYTGQLIFE